MSRANRLGMYADVRHVLDQALAAGGGTFQCGTPGAAVHWRQRAYKFRKLYAETLGPKGVSQYDTLVIPRLKPGSAEIELQIRQMTGTFTPANDVPQVPTDNDELLAEAVALAQRIGGE